VISKITPYKIPHRRHNIPIAYPYTPVNIKDYKNINEMLTISLMFEVRLKKEGDRNLHSNNSCW
jgi:hypothetical protein